jgi:hypothetical protein
MIGINCGIHVGRKSSWYSNWLHDSEVGVRFPAGISFTASRPALWPTQPPIQWVPGALSPGVKLPGREADHSLRTNAEVKNCGAIHLLSMRLHGVVLN